MAADCSEAGLPGCTSRCSGNQLTMAGYMYSSSAREKMASMGLIMTSDSYRLKTFLYYSTLNQAQYLQDGTITGSSSADGLDHDLPNRQVDHH